MLYDQAAQSPILNTVPSVVALGKRNYQTVFHAARGHLRPGSPLLAGLLIDRLQRHGHRRVAAKSRKTPNNPSSARLGRCRPGLHLEAPSGLRRRPQNQRCVIHVPMPVVGQGADGDGRHDHEERSALGRRAGRFRSPIPSSALGRHRLPLTVSPLSMPMTSPQRLMAR